MFPKVIRVNRSIRGQCIRTIQSALASSERHYRRVVITGLGALSPLGIGVSQSWTNLIDGKSGITTIKDEERYKDIPCKIAAYVPNIDEHLQESYNKNQLRTYSRSALYTLLAAKEAMEDCNFKKPEDDKQASRYGVAIGSGMVDFEEIITAGEKLSQGYSRVSPHFITKVLLNLPAGYVSMEYGLRGPNHTVSTACTTGAHAIGDAYNFIRNDFADLMIAGGVESSITPLSMAAFCRIRALCTKSNNNPQAASRPFDRDRNGFVMGEGVAVMVLEELNHARARNARIYGEILGYGLSADANHITAPPEDGNGARTCMLNAIRFGKLSADQIGHINCHATSTPIGDQAEINAIKETFSKADLKRLAVTSTKSSTGHLLGAAGATEALFTLLACHHGILPPTLNCHNPIDTDVTIVTDKGQQWNETKRIGITNSFGFGGTNASIVMCNFVD